MKVLICLDERGGILFNRRRLSRDSLLTEDICRRMRGETLYLSPYSAPLFAACQIPMRVSDGYLSEAGEDGVCFCENADLLAHAGRIDTVILYRWNRDYPYDIRLDTERLLEGMSIVENDSFKGSSHEKITREVWKK